ncbi:MAG: hypothetical protein EZS28_019274 [Streblomastix strix]|uniref:RRM domain-containing protein n=1 Tax=Streblomastix strix TaxID=222440 RepID=A0A5J4VRK5_9EUKA|nr:MAG: hypothetical protein EZS28_019274 [Streblomastix strix]
MYYFEITIQIGRRTGKSLGFAFVRFTNMEDAARALHAMDKKVLSGHEITIKYSNAPRNNISQALPNVNLYIKPLKFTTTESQLFQLFSPYGKILAVKIMYDAASMRSRQIGFVKSNEIDTNPYAFRAQLQITILRELKTS